MTEAFVLATNYLNSVTKNERSPARSMSYTTMMAFINIIFCRQSKLLLARFIDHLESVREDGSPTYAPIVLVDITERLIEEWVSSTGVIPPRGYVMRSYLLGLVMQFAFVHHPRLLGEEVARLAAVITRAKNFHHSEAEVLLRYVSAEKLACAGTGGLRCNRQNYIHMLNNGMLALMGWEERGPPSRLPDEMAAAVRRGVRASRKQARVSRRRFSV